MLKPEARLVNVKELMQSPYNVLIELLISGPKNEKLQGIIPENTKLLKSSLEGECLTLDFSEDLLNYDKKDEKTKDNLIYSIVNTVTELNEVNKVKFLINGQINDEFKEEYIRK
jgi:spore germination protein GerM